MFDMARLDPHARGILDAFSYHRSGQVITFEQILLDEEGYIWSADEDPAVESLVEYAFLRPVAGREPSPFLQRVAEATGHALNTRRVWQVTEEFKKLAA